MSFVLDEREVAEEFTGRWWIFLVTGIGWLVFALLLFQWDYTTIYAISYLFGFLALTAGINEFFLMPAVTTGWKWIHGGLGVLFIIAGIYALVHPRSAFATISGLFAFFILVKGIFDVTSAFMTKAVFELWWLQLVVGLLEIVLAFWVAGSFRDQVILLVVYVGIMALSRGFTELFFAFKLRSAGRRLAAV